jgi:hypothetical protein
VHTRSWPTSLITTSALLALAAPAQAGTIELRTYKERSWYVFTAAPGERNAVTVEMTAGGLARVTDTGAPITGACTPETPNTVVCPQGITLDAHLGDGDDTIADHGRTWLGEVLGGPGNDFLVGSRFDDVLKGGPGDDTLVSAGGDDRLDGGAGNDRHVLEGRGDPRVDCGAGRDRVDIELLGGVPRVGRRCETLYGFALIVRVAPSGLRLRWANGIKRPCRLRATVNGRVTVLRKVHGATIPVRGAATVGLHPTERCRGPYGRHDGELRFRLVR